MDDNRASEDQVEKHIRELTEKAKQLINGQMGQAKEEGGKRGRKQAGTSVTASVTAAGSTNIVAGATSQKQAAIRKGAQAQGTDDIPKRFYEDKNKKPEELKQMEWYEEYFKLEEDIEKMQEQNEKKKREIARRTERYVKNEKEYRQEINELERELRVRKRFEEDADATNQRNIKMIDEAIHENIDNYEEQLKALEDEQTKELARRYQSLVSRTKKSIEQEKAKSGDKAAEEAERENELQHHLELITNIAQRTEAENRELKKKNQVLKSKFQRQETDREYLVKKLVLQKKDNSKLQQEIGQFKQELKEQQKAREEQKVDLDNIEEPKLFSGIQTNSKLPAGAGGHKSAAKRGDPYAPSEANARTANFSATTAGRSTHMTAAGGLSRAASNQQSGPLVYVAPRKLETEEEKLRRYDRVMEKLRKMMQHERRLLKGARQQYNKELASKTELEILLKQAVDKVKSERKQHRKHAQMKVYTTQPGLGVGVNLVNPVVAANAVPGGTADEDTELNQHERERVIELMLSQERVIALLYEKTFMMTSAEVNGAEEVGDMEQLQQQQYQQQMDVGADADQIEGDIEEDEDYDPREAEAQYYAMQEEMFAEHQRQADDGAAGVEGGDDAAREMNGQGDDVPMRAQD